MRSLAVPRLCERVELAGLAEGVATEGFDGERPAESRLPRPKMYSIASSRCEKLAPVLVIFSIWHVMMPGSVRRGTTNSLSRGHSTALRKAL